MLSLQSTKLCIEQGSEYPYIANTYSLPRNDFIQLCANKTEKLWSCNKNLHNLYQFHLHSYLKFFFKSSRKSSKKLCLVLNCSCTHLKVILDKMGGVICQAQMDNPGHYLRRRSPIGRQYSRPVIGRSGGRVRGRSGPVVLRLQESRMRTVWYYD